MPNRTTVQMLACMVSQIVHKCQTTKRSSVHNTKCSPTISTPSFKCLLDIRIRLAPPRLAVLGLCRRGQHGIRWPVVQQQELCVSHSDARRFSMRRRYRRRTGVTVAGRAAWGLQPVAHSECSQKFDLQLRPGTRRRRVH